MPTSELVPKIWTMMEALTLFPILDQMEHLAGFVIADYGPILLTSSDGVIINQDDAQVIQVGIDSRCWARSRSSHRLAGPAAMGRKTGTLSAGINRRNLHTEWMRHLVAGAWSTPRRLQGKRTFVAPAGSLQGFGENLHQVDDGANGQVRGRLHDLFCSRRLALCNGASKFVSPVTMELNNPNCRGHLEFPG